jgi:hypothetical protein
MTDYAVFLTELGHTVYAGAFAKCRKIPPGSHAYSLGCKGNRIRKPLLIGTYLAPAVSAVVFHLKFVENIILLD